MKSIIHALGHNRARQRDKLAHILEEFAALQDEVRDLTSVNTSSDLPLSVENVLKGKNQIAKESLKKASIASMAQPLTQRGYQFMAG